MVACGESRALALGHGRGCSGLTRSVLVQQTEIGHGHLFAGGLGSSSESDCSESTTVRIESMRTNCWRAGYSGRSLRRRAGVGDCPVVSDEKIVDESSQSSRWLDRLFTKVLALRCNKAAVGELEPRSSSVVPPARQRCDLDDLID